MLYDIAMGQITTQLSCVTNTNGCSFSLPLQNITYHVAFLALWQCSNKVRSDWSLTQVNVGNMFNDLLEVINGEWTPNA